MNLMSSFFLSIVENGLKKEDKALLIEMFRFSNSDFLRFASRLALEELKNRKLINCQLFTPQQVPIHRIYGSIDLLFPVDPSKLNEKNDLLVQGGGHLMNITHPIEINQQIEKILIG